MDFNKKFLRSVSLIMVILMIIPSLSYAKSFKDVPPSHWAYKFVDKMSDLGFISGDPGGTFRPSDSLTYLETLTLLSKLLTISSSEKAGVEQLRSTVTKYEVPEWAQESVMKCLYKGVISENELKTAYDNDMIRPGTKAVPNRLTISVYLAKAMGLDEIANNKPFVSLSYKDLYNIDAKYHKILYTLIEAGVLSPQGTGTGNFEPKAKIQRDAMATMLYNAYNYLQDNPPISEVETEVVRGILNRITVIGANTFLTIEGESLAFIVDSSTEITIDNKKVTTSSLYEGQELELTIKKGSTSAIKVEGYSVEDDISGIIKSVTPSSYKLVVEYEQDRTTKTAELTVDKDADIYLNGKVADLYDLKAGDAVDIYSKNNIALEIEAMAKSGKAEGEIVDIQKDDRSSTTKYFITLEDSKGNESEYELDSKAYIYRNNRSAKAEDLRVGDFAYVILEYGVIVDIDAEIIEKDIEGFITGISTRLNQNTEITIKNRETGKEESYELTRGAVIKVDNKIASAYDLVVGYFVEAVVGGNEVIEIYADSVSSEYLVRGKVAYVDIRYNELELNVEGSEIEGVEYGDKLEVRTSRDVTVKSYFSSKSTFSDIKKGDKLFIYGYYDGTTFIANEIEIRP